MSQSSYYSKEAKKILKSTFGYKSFLDNQENIIKTIMSQRDVFAAMPTGGGKSLCYQIPGILFDGLSVVISPLIALMKDQVDEAIDKGIPAAFLNSSLESHDAAKIYTRLYQNEIKLLYISPERLAIEGYLEKLRDLNVHFFAVDEAHCLSEWGHDFRPDYLSLSHIRNAFPKVPIAAFTATATQRVQKDIIRILNLNEPFCVRASFNRKELDYQIRSKTDVLSQIAAFIEEHPEESGIVYRISRKDTEKTAEFLSARGIRALPYHAGLSQKERIRNQERFNNDEAEIITATTAFGMGINKNNVRYVIHGDLPKSMEGYYQETGRAGRDGMDSTCVLFFSTGDIAKQQYLINQIENPDEQEKNKRNLNQIIRFATVHVCRRKQILEYFNEEFKGVCANCDVCNDRSPKTDAIIDAQKVLSAIMRTNEGFGMHYIIDILRGTETERIKQRQHHFLKTFGIGKDKSRLWWRGILDELLGQEMIYQDSECYNVLRITELGKAVLFGRKPFYISETTAVRKEPKSLNMESNNQNFLRRLKQTRTKLARINKVPPYIVFSDKTLVEMAQTKPANNQEFLGISGVGEKKLEAYGSIFLSVIRDCLEEEESE